MAANSDFERTWHARYEQWALKYDADHLISGWSAEGLARRFELLLALLGRADLRPGGRVLDLGSGPGTYTREIAARKFRCVGLDYSHNVLLAARQKSKEEPYVQGNAYHLPFRSQSFDAVICIGVLQSLDRAAAALGEIGRVLAPGGWIFLDGLNRFFWLCWARRIRSLAFAAQKPANEYNPYQVRRLCEAIGFAQSEIHWLTVPQRAQMLARVARGKEWPLASTVFGHSFLLAAKTKG
jgi:ubiquinone/menaquinone biosynthesis C-methylase UbiE